MQTSSQFFHRKFQVCPVLAQIDAWTYAWCIFFSSMVRGSMLPALVNSSFLPGKTPGFASSMPNFPKMFWTCLSFGFVTTQPSMVYFPVPRTQKKAQVHLPCLQVLLLSIWKQTSVVGSPTHFSRLLLGHKHQNHQYDESRWLQNFCNDKHTFL